MVGEFQDAIDHDNLEDARNNLNEFTNKIHKNTTLNIDNEDIDKVHIDFICKNELNFDEINLVKQVFDFIKSKNIKK